MRYFFFAAVSCAALLSADQVSADDSSAALGMGGVAFTQSADIRMADEDLRISPKDVRIRFTFANDGAKDIDTIVAFPLPDIDTSEFSESALGTTTRDPVNFVGFTLNADGKPVPVSVEQRALYKGHDFTALLKSLGVPVNIVVGDYKKLDGLSPADKKKLEAADLIDNEGEDHAHPHWTVQTRFYWKQHFPAGKTVVFEQSYQPVTGQFFFGGAYFLSKTDNYGPSLVKSYCIDDATLAGLQKTIAEKLKAEPQAGGYLNAYETDYILSTGNNWKGPIGRFHLALDKLKPDNVLSLCWDGALRKTGPTTFESTRDNFAPKSDIKLLVLDKHPPGG